MTSQSACNLRTEITPVTAGSLVLAFAVLPLTEMVTPGSIYGTFMGMPKIYSLVNKTGAKGHTHHGPMLSKQLVG